MKKIPLNLLLIGNTFLFILLLGIITYEGIAIYNITNFATINPADQKIKKTTPVNFANVHLFGVPPLVQPKSEKESAWTLRGIILGTNASGNRVILSSATLGDALYQRGEKLEDGTIIETISADRVVLSHNGIIETLFIPWKENQSEGTEPIMDPLTNPKNIE